jgi:UDP-glucuronate 4-epimerase
VDCCLVTGAAGFIGFHLCEALLERGCFVLGVDNLNDYYDAQLKDDRLSKLRKHPKFLFSRVDLSEREPVAKLFTDGRFDLVFHFAAQAGVRHSLENPRAYIESNLVGFANVLEGCRQSRPSHFLYASSSSVYGANSKMPFAVDDPAESPMSLYAATKRSNELLAFSYSHLYDLPTTGLRLFTVYGPWGRPDMAIYKFTRAMLAGEPIDVFNYGRMRRDFTYVDDVIAGVLQAARKPPALKNAVGTKARWRLYNLGNNCPVELRELISILEELLGVTAEVRYHARQPGEVLETSADIEASTRDLEFRPRVTLREGLERFVLWYREYHQASRQVSEPAVQSAGHRANAWNGEG